jgi:hypothetical protein
MLRSATGSNNRWPAHKVNTQISVNAWRERNLKYWVVLQVKLVLFLVTCRHLAQQDAPRVGPATPKRGAVDELSTGMSDDEILVYYRRTSPGVRAASRHGTSPRRT